MDYDSASHTLRWKCTEDGRNPELLRLLRLHAGTLRQLHVMRGDRPAMAALLEILPSCVSLTALEFRWVSAALLLLLATRVKSLSRSLAGSAR